MKVWWRFVVVLMCRLFVGVGYGGERFIELFGSWLFLKCFLG